jgi:hypothetical protein
LSRAHPVLLSDGCEAAVVREPLAAAAVIASKLDCKHGGRMRDRASAAAGLRFSCGDSRFSNHLIARAATAHFIAHPRSFGESAYQAARWRRGRRNCAAPGTRGTSIIPNPASECDI